VFFFAIGAQLISKRRSEGSGRGIQKKIPFNSEYPNHCVTNAHLQHIRCMNVTDLQNLSPEEKQKVIQVFGSGWRFGETFFVNSDGSPRRYWDHQKAELDDPHPRKIHCDGTETGKTILIATSILHWGATTVGQVGLCVAPLSGQLAHIIGEVEFQIAKSNFVRSLMIPGQYHKSQPYYRIFFAGGSSVIFCPASSDGSSYDGVHANRIWVDQACSIPKKAWSVLFQRQEPGCVFGIYSYHDGRRDSEYHAILSEAVEIPTSSSEWKKYHWSMTILPYPRWSKQREKEKIKEHGSKESSEYQRMVLGLVGKPTFSAFDVESLFSCQQEIPQYETLVITNEEFEGCETEDDIDKAVASLIGAIGSPGRPGENTWGGADLGYTSDPAEITVAREKDGFVTSRLRIHLEKVPYTTQAKIIGHLDQNFKFSAFGIDRGGNGMSVMQMLQNNDEFLHLPNRKERFLGFDFGGNLVISVDDETGTEEKQNTKEFATSLINGIMRRRRWAIPKDKQDPAIEEQFISHTYVKSSRHIIYGKKNDHIIDSYRVLFLARETVTRLRDLDGGIVEEPCTIGIATGPVFD